jgi:hypothetical protein
MVIICLNSVDLPLSPAPSNSSLLIWFSSDWNWFICWSTLRLASFSFFFAFRSSADISLDIQIPMLADGKLAEQLQIKQPVVADETCACVCAVRERLARARRALGARTPRPVTCAVHTRLRAF